MQFWSLFLAIFGLLIAAAQLWDRHYLRAKTSTAIRDRLIGLYVKLDETTPSVTRAELKEFLLLPLQYALPGILFYGGILYAAKLISDTLYYFLLSFVLAFIVPVFVFSLGIVFTILMAIIALLYAASRWILVHALDKMSDPRTSPFTYLFSMIGLAVAAAKAITDIVKTVVL